MNRTLKRELKELEAVEMDAIKYKTWKHVINKIKLHFKLKGGD
jgi:hypothetical protein